VIPIIGIVAGYYHLKEDVLGFDLFGISFVLSAIAISWVGLTRKKGI
jgi:drug/metabolite transporter (DMT)-like permease